MRKNLLLAVTCSLVGLSPLSSTAQQPSVKTKADVDRLVEEFSNWGRWGDDDQRGTLNLITPEIRLQASRLVKTGVSVSLARRVDQQHAADNGQPFQHQMLAYGRDSSGPWAMDQYTIAYHGVAHTHMDSLCHLFYNGQMYNGISRDQVGPEGAEKLSIEIARGGIFTRGILIDLPRFRGVRFLEPAMPIMADELEAWERQSGIEVHAGDVVFFRTGRWARRAVEGPWNPSEIGMAGLHASCAKWIHDHDLAMVGSDAALDVIPSGVEGVTHPMHVFVLHAMGTPIFDNCDLESVAKECASQDRWEFLLTAAPLVVEGGTGSPLNPIATF